MGIDYHDFVGIVILLVVNSTISFVEENNAGNAAAALMARLAPKAKVISTYIAFYKYYLPALLVLKDQDTRLALRDDDDDTFFCRLCVMAPGMN